MTTFVELGVDQDIVDALAARGIVDAFPIQEQTIPLGLPGQDIIGQAKTGTGKTFGFDEAKEMGIVNEVFPKESFWADVVKYATQFAPPHKASKAVGMIKRSVQSGAEVPFESGLAIERELQQQLFQSEDAKEGLAAYVEKRTPQFKGR